jgi:hypothetical protein
LDKFRYYYQIANEIINEEETPPADAAPPVDAAAVPPEEPTDTPPPIDAGAETGDMGAAATPPVDGIKNPVDKVEKENLIKNVDDKTPINIAEQIDNLSIKLLEKKEKIQTVIEALSFLNNIDTSKPKKYLNEEKFKKLNGILTSKNYEDLSVTNLYGLHNALKENFKTVQKDYKDKKENKKMVELKVMAKKAKRARFTKNINQLNDKINEIKNNLNNINQVFDLSGFSKQVSSFKDEVGLAQTNSSEFIKKLS